MKTMKLQKKPRNQKNRQNLADPTKKLLLHSCCEDCAQKALASLEGKFSEILLYFDNSNIHPRTEYLARLAAFSKKPIIANWEPRKWFKAIEYNSDNTEGRRCKLCWKFRLGRTAEKSRELGIINFSSTLLSSKHQDWDSILEIGKRAAKEDLRFIEFRAKDLKTKGFYKQNYCGCCFSLVERYKEKFC